MNNFNLSSPNRHFFTPPEISPTRKSPGNPGAPTHPQNTPPHQMSTENIAEKHKLTHERDKTANKKPKVENQHLTPMAIK